MPEAIFSNPTVLFTPGNVFFKTMTKSNTTCSQDPANALFSSLMSQNCWKPNPEKVLQQKCERFTEKMKENARGYQFLLIVFLSILSLIKSPNLNKLSTVSIEIKEVICEENSSEERIR
jgi:hypothetical protein